MQTHTDHTFDIPHPPLTSIQTPQCTAAYLAFLNHLSPGAHLLDAGCGDGTDLGYFRQLGYQVTAFDANLAQAKAASCHAGQPVRVCHFLEFTSVVPYDGIWANASLPSLPLSELPATLAHLTSLLKPGAPLYCSFPHTTTCGINQAESTTLPQDTSNSPLLTSLDLAGLQALTASLPLKLQSSWVTSPDPQQVNGGTEWLHAIFIRQEPVTCASLPARG